MNRMNHNVMSKLPLVSIVMPAYNSEKYITEAINSVIAQTYDNWKLIVIDDCSQDKTVECVSILKESDPRITLYKNDKNLGVSKTRAKGICIADSEYIAFLDSDDCWRPTKLAQQMELILSDNEIDFVFTASAFMDEESHCYKWIMSVPTVVTYKRLLYRNIISCSSVLIKKKYLLERKTVNNAIHEDFALWLQILSERKSAYGINQPLLVYRVSKKSKSGNKLKSALMTYRTYRILKINVIKSLYYMIFYSIHGLRKYHKLYKSGYIGEE